MIKISLENGTSINIDTRDNKTRSQEGLLGGLAVIGGISVFMMICTLINTLVENANSKKIRKIIDGLPPEEKKKVFNYVSSMVGELTKMDKEITSKGMQVLKNSEKVFKYCKCYDERVITDYSGEASADRRKNLQTNKDTKDRNVIAFLKHLVSLSKNIKNDKATDYDIYAHIEYWFVIKDYYYNTEHEDEDDPRVKIGEEWIDGTNVDKFYNALQTGTKQMFNSIKGSYKYLILECHDPEIEEYESCPYKNTGYDGFKAVGTGYEVYLDSKKLKEAFKPIIDKL